MKIKRKRHFEAGVETGSMNDIMFFLMLFFLLVATLGNPNIIPLLLPGAKASSTIAKKQLTLSITEDKKYFIDRAEVQFPNLETELVSRTTQQNSDVTVILRADNRLTVQDLVDILAIGSKNHIKMLLATNQKK
jgi:biopolymer transport protein ExbD